METEVVSLGLSVFCSTVTIIFSFDSDPSDPVEEEDDDDDDENKEDDEEGELEAKETQASV